MKGMNVIKRILWSTVLLYISGPLPGQAATINWTNMAGGDWGVASNWEPNQLPGSADTAVIGAPGTYTVTLNGSATIGELTVGGTDGQQTMACAAGATLNASNSTVNTNGIMTLNGDTFLGGSLTINGQLNWYGDYSATVSTISGNVTVGSNGVVVVEPGSCNIIAGILTNAGTINISMAGFQLSGDGTNGGLFVNLAGGLVHFQNDCADIFGVTGNEVIANEGTILSGYSGGLMNIAAFINNGTVDAEGGCFALSQTREPATLLSGSGTYIGAGTNLICGTATLMGTLITSNLDLPPEGILVGSNGVIAGVMYSSGGTMSGTLTIATNGVLVVTDAGATITGILTNAGTINMGSPRLDGDGVTGGLLVNLPGAVMSFQIGDELTVYGTTGNEVVVNQGTVLSSNDGAGFWNLATVNNSGTVDVESGTLYLCGNSTLGSGTLHFGIRGSNDYGAIWLPGNPAPLGGAISASLENGYIPAPGSSFAVVTYGSYTGSFSSFNLPPIVQWQSDYGASALALNAVHSVAPTNSCPQWCGNGSFQFTFNATSGVGYVLEASSDMIHWIALGATNTNATGVATMIDTNAWAWPDRFYRLQIVNPQGSVRPAN